MDGAPIVADVFELKSGVPERLRARGADVTIAALRAGDYAIGRVLVERKNIRDLHLSIASGRFWPQIGRLRQGSRFPYLLVEGRDLDHGPLAPDAIRGACLAVGELGVAVVRAADADDSASWLSVLARRVARPHVRRVRPAYAQRPKSPPSSAAEAMLAAVPGISAVHARRLLERFGSVAEVVAASTDDWLSVPGIGPVRAVALARTIGPVHRAR